ncbi:DsbA family oxidoreductase [Aeromicrobium sp.]|uniref:DsbA family oxidoreductase n=1 Tax=Aeromicrobium sp. TaxID=1871063 RepID=UPI003D6AF02B
MKALVFADVTDPWSYIGATRFERAAATFTIVTGEPVDISLRAMQLEPDTPSSGRPLMEALAERLGGEDKAEFLNVQVTAGAKITGIELNFAEAVEANSFDAWRLLTWAEEAGLGVQRDLAHQLWRAHLLEGADIADPLVLSSRAALVGLDLETTDALLASDEYAAEVRKQDETARSLGIAQLPYVVVETRWILAGVHSQNDYVQALRQIHHEWSADDPG